MQWCPCPWSLPTRSDTCRSSLPPPLTCVHGLQIHHPAPGGAKTSAPPGPSRLPQPGPRRSQGLFPPALCRRSCRHCGSRCHLSRALSSSGWGSTPRPGLAHSPGEHAARGGGLGHAPWQGPRAWPWAHAKQRFAYMELGARRGVSKCCRGESRPRGTPVCRDPAWQSLPITPSAAQTTGVVCPFGEPQVSAWLGSRKVNSTTENP